jgi:predicted permease
VHSDLRYCLRSLAQSPRFTVTAVLVLALGIGATTAMFSVVYSVLLRPLEYPRPEQLVFVQESSLRHGGIFPTAPGTYIDWRDQQDVFQSIAAAEAWGATLTGSGRPEEVDGLRASTSLLSVLGTAPMLGRGFEPEDERTEAGHVVLLSHRLWERRFGSDPSIVGRAITISGASYKVIGVMPAGFRFPPFWATKAELWIPLTFPPDRLHSRSGRSLRVFARLKEGVSLEQANAALSAIAARIAAAYPATNTDSGARVIPLRDMTVGKVRQGLFVLLGAVGFLLLIACANVANLLLGRASGRSREVAVRLALGAGRWRLVRQLLVESLALSLAGGAAGVVLSSWLLQALATNIAEASRSVLPRSQEIGMGGAVLLFSFAVSAATGILFGLVPALQFSRPDLHASLKEGGRGNSRAARTPLRSLLVSGEIAVSVMLLAGAGLMIRSFQNLGAVDAGFDPRNVLTLRVVLTGSPYAATPERRNAFYRQVLDRVAETTGVESVSGINHLPLAGDLWTFGYTVEGHPPPPPSQEPSAAFRVSFPGYFRTMRIPVLRGRDFTAHDTADAARVVIVNEAMARRQWPGVDAIGRRIRVGDGEPWYTVVGVVKNAEEQDWGKPLADEFYFPQWQNPQDIQRYLTLVVRTAGDPKAMTGPVQSAIAALDRDLPIEDIASMQQVVDRAVWQPRFSTTLLAAFAGLALVLAAVGIYGVMSSDVARRTPEIGIRMALGARPGDVLRSVLRQGAKLTAIGAAAGLAGAIALTRYLRTLLYAVSPTDPLVLGAASVVLAAVAMAAVWLPARRATRVDPIEALRVE